MAKRGVKPGRWIVTAGLISFVLVSAAIVARRSYGYRESAELAALERRKANLVSERTRLEQQIREASSRARLQPIAERALGMRMPSESQIVVLRRTAEPDGSP